MASRPAPEVPAAPGLPAPGLESYRVPADGSAGTFRLLVIPVRFPEDGVLGGGGESALYARLTDTGVSGLAGFYRAATRGRIRVEVVLAPTVVPAHERTYYTSEGDDNLGFGIDPDAYPHNAQSLAEEATARVAGAVDFRAFDNTGDGIADGVLLLHSGPAAPEAGGVSDRSALLAHAFTLPAPAPRGDGVVFPYAVASTSDGMGVWAHETGHLLGLPDRYVGNPYTPGEGVGPWSLMATGANAGGGNTPAGFDAASLLDLGIPAVLAPGEPVALPDTTCVRTFRAGEETGPEYFLIERRDGSDGLWVPGPATLVYRVNERVGDNRDPSRPRVELLAAVCAGTTPCTAFLDDATDPPLHDSLGRPTRLRLDFTRDTVAARHTQGSGLLLAAAALSPPWVGQRSRILLTLRNTGDAAVDTPVEVTFPTDPWCPNRVGSGTLSVPAHGEAVDDSWEVVACGFLPVGPPLAVTVRFGPGLSDSARVVIVAGPLPGFELQFVDSYRTVNLAPGRADPWSFADGVWTARDPAPLADAVLVTPWFTVPDSGRLVLDHAWDAHALAPDYAQDAFRVELDAQTEPLRVLEGAGGWGYRAEPGTGNALGGSPVLAGSGDRVHVLDLAAYAGRTVRLRFRAAGDVAQGPGRWVLRRVRAGGPPATTMTLDAGDGARVVLRVRGEAAEAALHAGPAPTTPAGLLAAPAGDADIPDPHAVPGIPRRYELTWRDEAGRAGSAVLALLPEPGSTGRLAALPNPVRAGEGQRWILDRAPDAPGGEHRFVLWDAAGRVVAERAAVFVEAGSRALVWSGRDDAGRISVPGVYFLRCRLPDGSESSEKIVVLP